MQLAEAELFREHLKSKTVRKSDLGGNLAFPVELLDYVWPEGVPYDGARVIQVLDIKRKLWRFKCRLRRDKEHRPKPEVHGEEWMSFIGEKQIRVEDKLDVYRAPAPPPNGPVPPPNEAPVFVISVKRRIRLGGENISADIRL